MKSIEKNGREMQSWWGGGDRKKGDRAERNSEQKKLEVLTKIL